MKIYSEGIVGFLQSFFLLIEEKRGKTMLEEIDLNDSTGILDIDELRKATT